MGWFLFHIFGCKGIKKNVYEKMYMEKCFGVNISILDNK